MKQFILLIVSLFLFGCQTPTVEIEEGASIVMEVENQLYGDAIIALWNETYPEHTGALTVNVVEEHHAIREYFEAGAISADIYLVADTFVPTLFAQSRAIAARVEESFEVGYPDSYVASLKGAKHTFVPMNVNGMFYAYNMSMLSSHDVTSFEALYRSGVSNAIYVDPNNINVFPFTTLEGFDLFQEDKLSVENMQSEQCLRMLQQLKKISQQFNLLDANGYYDNWFMDNAYASGFLHTGMQFRIYEEYFGDILKITDIPTVGLYPMKNIVSVNGYSVKETTRYPNMVEAVLGLIRSQAGMQAYIETTDRFAAITHVNRSSFIYNDTYQEEITKALSDSIARPLTAMASNPDVSIVEWYVESDVIDIMKAMSRGVISAERAQQELVQLIEDWIQDGNVE
ncbi:MAG: hypothetical protein ACRCZJ_08650 [Erysipelotrichaceae bacterium]